jgi:hypothetical protein
MATRKPDEWRTFVADFQAENYDAALFLMDHLIKKHKAEFRTRGQRKHLTHATAPTSTGVISTTWEYRARGSNSGDIRTIIRQGAEKIGVKLAYVDVRCIAMVWVDCASELVDDVRRRTYSVDERDLDCWVCDAVAAAKASEEPLLLMAHQGDTELIDAFITKCPLHSEPEGADN